MVKTFGAITKYYPFIEDETKSLLDTLMEESDSYFDFVQQLSKYVLEKEVPVNLVYIAAVNAWWCRIESTIQSIQETHKHLHCIRPWGYPHANMTLLMKLHDSVVEAIEKARSANVEDWMEVELHLLHSYFHYPYHGDIPSLLQPLTKARELLDVNPLLKCFEPLICALEGHALRMEGDVEASIAKLGEGLKCAEVYDDSLYKYVILVNYAESISRIDVQRALCIYEDLYELAQDFDVPYLLSEVLNDSAIAFEIAGEYDLAISSNLEVIKIIGENFWTSTILSRIYACLEYGQRAFEEINQYIEKEGTPEYPSWGFARARALAHLNRFEDAERDLESIHSEIIKMGSEAYLSIYYHISGILEMRKGYYVAAMDTLEKCLEISERVPHTERNYILIDLAKTELALAQSTPDTSRSYKLGKWLSTLEKYGSDYKLPGIRMQAAMLKSEHYRLNGQIKDAKATLLSALTITDSLGVRTLRMKIENKINELNALIKESEIGE